MDITILLRGIIIGFSIAAPVGPIGVLCIRRTLGDGRAIGFASGMGAATADALYGCVAAFGLTLVSNFLIGQKFWLSLIGGLFLIYLGVKTSTSRPAESSSPDSLRGRGLIAAYASTLFLTLTNPATILSFLIIFAGLGIVNETRNSFAAFVLVIGVFIGSALWWLSLSLGVGFFRDKFNATAMTWVNKISGSIIFAFGTVALLSLIISK
jgi:threonine/homoserine/homoserine lactone efflux protein